MRRAGSPGSLAIWTARRTSSITQSLTVTASVP